MKTIFHRVGEFEVQSAGASIEQSVAGNEFVLTTEVGIQALANGFVPRWRVGELVVGFTGDKYQVLAEELFTLAVLPQALTELESLDFLAYNAEYTINGVAEKGRRVIISQYCRDLLDVMVERKMTK